MIYNKIPKTKKFQVVSADTETYTLIDGVKVSTEQLNKIGLTNDTSFFRKHASIDVYAWQISTGLYDAICSTFDEWCTLICKHKVGVIWFYNAKFDFAQIDYQILSNGDKWKPYSKENLRAGYNCYTSLHSPFGARYSYTIWYYYENKNKKRVAHKFVIYDLMNIFTGGLAKLLENFDIEDEAGNKLRKLEMDYQTNTDVNGNYTEEAIKYMIMDVKGLYYLIKKCNDYIEARYNMRLMPKPDFMTAGGFAKKLLLETLYNKGDYRENLKAFQSEYVMFLGFDKFIRKGGLYQGGKCIVNPKYQNKFIDKEFKRFDYNSHYPARMREAVAFKGRAYKLSFEEYIKFKNEDNAEEKYIFILHLLSWRGYLKENMLPVWYDYELKKYTDTPFNTESETGLLIFEFEFNEYLKWYDFDYDIDYVIMYKKTYDYNYVKFVDMLYKDKTEGKKTKNKCQEMFSKLGLNSAYGKFAQNPYNLRTHREINEETGAVHIVADEVEADEKNIMSVIQGAYITARGRVELCKSIREKCITTPANDFYYCDTDSIHGNFVADADAFEIGKLKLEAVCKYGLFLAPKTYFEIDENNIIEVHTKGVPNSTIYNVMIKKGAIDKLHKVIDLYKVLEIFKAGNKFQTLASLNIKGGKALIPLFKELCKEDNTNTDNIYMSNLNGENELYEI